MCQKITQTTYKLLFQTTITEAHTIAKNPRYDWYIKVFSIIFNSVGYQTPSFEPNRVQNLSFNAKRIVTEAHIQKEDHPRFNFAERYIEKSSSSGFLSNSIHMLNVLFLMEKDIEPWKQKHKLEIITTPKTVHFLYCKLFQKVELPKNPFPPSTCTKSCFFNVAIQTPFSHPELAAMVLIFQAVDALNGVTNKLKPDQEKILSHLTPFITSLLGGKPFYDSFKELPQPLQKLLFNLWSSSDNLSQMTYELNQQLKLKNPFSIPKTPGMIDMEVFSIISNSVGYQTLLLILEPNRFQNLSFNAEAHNQKEDPPRFNFAEKKVSREKFVEDRIAVRRARIVNKVFSELAQVALTCGVIAAKLIFNKKSVNIENIIKDSSVLLQTPSSLTRILLTGMDPLSENKYLQLGQQFAVLILIMAQNRQNRSLWNFAPIASSVIQLSLSHTKLSEPAKALAVNFGPLIFTDVLSPSYQGAFTLAQFGSLVLTHLSPPQRRENIALYLSALYSTIAQLVAPQLEQHSNLDHIRTSLKGKMARALQVLITNPSLQSLVTEVAAKRLTPPKALPALYPEDHEKDYSKKKSAYEVANENVKEIERKLTANQQDQSKISAPKDDLFQATIPVIAHFKSKKGNHHLSYVDRFGQRQGLGKYHSKDAQFISTQWSELMIESENHDQTCYAVQQQLAAQGIPFEDIPKRPHFELPTIPSNDASKNYQTMINALHSYRLQKSTYITQLQKIADEQGLQVTQTEGLTTREIKEFSQTVIPHIKDDPKKHGFWYRAWRSPGKTYDATSEFLTKIGFSGVASTRPIPIYSTKPSKSTPSYPENSRPVISTKPKTLPAAPNTLPPVSMPSLPVRPVSEPYLAPVLQNPFLPAAPNTLPPVSVPFLPVRPVSKPSPRLTFGERLKGILTDILGHGFVNRGPLQLVSRNQVMVFPQERSTFPVITSDLQNRYPEVYPLSQNIDRFKKEKTIENHQRPHLFQELDALPRLLKKATGHSLQTPGIHLENQKPLSLKVEALAVATWDTTKNFVIESVRHPIQSRIDLSVGATKRVGHYLKEGMKFLVNTRDPNDRISIEMVETMDTVAANLDGLFTTWIQRHNPKHNPNSSSTRVGRVALDIALWETGLRLLKGGRVLTAAESIPLASERLGIQSQRAILETINRPVYRSGFVSDKTVARLADRNISKIKPQKNPTPIRAQIALNKKLSALQDAQKKAVNIRKLPDGRVRYYEAIRASKTPGPTKGGAFVTEYNPKTGKVCSWNECYDIDGSINRVHPKTIDGQDIVGQHYPPTKAEIDAFLK